MRHDIDNLSVLYIIVKRVQHYFAFGCSIIKMEFEFTSRIKARWQLYRVGKI